MKAPAPGYCTVLLLTWFCVLTVGCSSDTPASSPLSAFQPQIASNTDNFQFQVTAATNVTATVTYPWQNTGKSASVNQSSAITGGSAVVTLFDSLQIQRYTSSLSANGTFMTDTAGAGTWMIRVDLTNLSGTLNFRAQKH